MKKSVRLRQAIPIHPSPQVFDAGLIGEGALHVMASAQRLLAPGGRLVPVCARVYAVPCCVRRVESVVCCRQVVKTEPLNLYHRRGADYEAIDLTSEHWTPAAVPVEVLRFTFGDVPQPQSMTLDMTATKETVVNAVAFWFELDLDETETLSSSPFGGSGGHWAQACGPINSSEAELPGNATDLIPLNPNLSLSQPPWF